MSEAEQIKGQGSSRPVTGSMGDDQWAKIQISLTLQKRQV